MRTRVGTHRARAMLGSLVLGLTFFVGAASCGSSPTGLAENDDICYLIDGQIYCFPSAATDSSQAHPRPAIP